MRSFAAFTKKEFLEMIRTNKLLILLVVFALLGFMNPITAKMTPDLLKDLVAVEGVEIPESTLYDSWAQFFKNIPQMGIVVITLIFSSSISREVSKGTLINLLTKGMKRKNIILTKFLTMVATWTCCYLIAFGITLSYSRVFWEAAEIDNLALALFSVWIFGVIIISSLILGGVISKYSYGSLLVAGCLVVIMMIGNLLREIAKFNPLQLVTRNMELIKGTAEINDFYWGMMAAAILSVAFIMSSIWIFNKKSL